MDATQLVQPHTALVVGAGPVGALTALGLVNLGWQVTLIERESLSDHALPSSYDNRQLALTPQSVDWLIHSLGLTQLSSHLTPITQIHTSSKGLFGSLLMTANQQGLPALGYTISQRLLGQVIFSALAKTSVLFETGVTLSQLTQTSECVTLTGTSSKHSSSVNWQAERLFAADGAQSWVRNTLGISSKTTHYSHHLMTAIGTLNQPHNHLAIERFTPTGPTAMLPLAQPSQVKLVYCYDVQEIEQISQFTAEQLMARINEQLGNLLPNIIQLDEVCHYPLMEVKPDQIQQQRTLLIGNAAHTQHPVAGQGLNLGIRDVQAVVEWAKNPVEANWTAMAEARLNDHRKIMRATHGLVSLFSNPKPVVRRIASAGLQIIDLITPLKKRITRMAMGY